MRAPRPAWTGDGRAVSGLSISMTDFNSLGLAPSLLDALTAKGFTTPTPIQAKAIPPALAGRDVLGLAQTGTGKTAAFALPTLQRLAAAGRKPAPKSARVLVLTPTRELASQVAETFEEFGAPLKLSTTVVYGGVGYTPQAKAMQRGVDVLVATPGRLLDLMNQGDANLGSVEVAILDEADRMLDMGFIHDVKKVVAKLPKERQTLFFSATMPDSVAGLAASLLKDHVRVEVTPPASTVDRIQQSVMHMSQQDKPRALIALLQDPDWTRTIVFSRTKHGANRIAEKLEKAGISAAAIHGNKSQSARERALEGFRTGTVRALIATDIAARGIDVEGVSHVVNYDLPEVPEAYVHRIGRTARAGRDGVAVAFCAPDEKPLLKDIEKAIRRSVPQAATPELAELPPGMGPESDVRPPRPPQGRGRGGQRSDRQPRNGQASPAPTRNAQPAARDGQVQQQSRGPKPSSKPAQPQARSQAQPQGRPQAQGQPRAQQDNQAKRGPAPARSTGAAGQPRREERPRADRSADGRESWGAGEVPAFMRKAAR